MRYSFDNNVLTIYLEGELNSYNATGVESEIEDILDKQSFDKLVLDFSRIRYISSAGLRVVLKLKQRYQDFSIVETTLEVYDILEMTGFTNIMDIRKALNSVSIQGAEVIGDGFTATVYRLNKDTIIKVFKENRDIEKIERELKLAKEAFILGIPTAISFDVVKVDDKYGVRFEMLDCNSLQEVAVNHPEKLKEYLDKYTALLKKMNTTECLNPSIPNIKDSFVNKFIGIKEHVPSNYYEKALRMLNEIPDTHTLIHGDCHFKNIMVQKDELVLIDMDSLSVGNPIFELAGLHFAYVAFDECGEGSTNFFNVSKENCSALYNALINRYFGKDDKAIKDKIAIVSFIHMMFWNKRNEKDNIVRFNAAKELLFKLLDKYSDLII